MALFSRPKEQPLELRANRTEDCPCNLRLRVKEVRRPTFGEAYDVYTICG